jgi:hypothetical protein
MAITTASDKNLSFEFHLRPVDEISPWGADSPNLHWFGLSDGWFWIDAGGEELFRYSDAMLEHWRKLSPNPDDVQPYTEYQVVRYWEDLLEILPAVLQPLPDDLAAIVAQGETWQKWQDDAIRWVDDSAGDRLDTYCMALRWWALRAFSECHLVNPPFLWFWRVGDTLFVRWDNRGLLIDDIPVWQAQFGEISLPVAQFVQQMTAFTDRFIAAMEDRVAAIRSHWGRPEIAIDCDGLDKEQRERSTWLTAALTHGPREYYDWDDVRAAMARIESDLRS